MNNRRRDGFRFFIYFITLLLLTAADESYSQAESHQHYFPLCVGNSWTYSNGEEEKTFTIIGSEWIKGYQYYRFNQYTRVCGFPGHPVEADMLFRYDPGADQILQLCPVTNEDWIRYDFSGNEWDPIGHQMLESGLTCQVAAGEFENCCQFGFAMNVWCGYYRETLAPHVGNIEFITTPDGHFTLHDYTIVPEPTGLMLLGVALLHLARLRRR